MTNDIDALFGLEPEDEESDAVPPLERVGPSPRKKRRMMDHTSTVAPGAASSSCASISPTAACSSSSSCTYVSDSELDDFFGVVAHAKTEHEPMAAVLEQRVKQESIEQESDGMRSSRLSIKREPSHSSRPSNSASSAYDAEAAHLASIKQERDNARSTRAKREDTHPMPYKPILSNRDVLFTAPILGDEPVEGETQPVFTNAPTSFSTNPYFATGNSTQFPFMPRSTEELARMLHKREDLQSLDTKQQEGLDASSNPSWPITMKGKSIQAVSASNAVKAKVARRAEREHESEIQESASTMPTDKHVHGPGISDRSAQKAHWDGYWEMRVAKLNSQRADKNVYADLDLFKTKEQLQADQLKQDRKRKIEEEKEEKEWLEDTDLPFSLAQSAPTQVKQEVQSTPTSAVSSSQPSASSADSSAPTKSRPAGGIFSGVVAYINGDTETRLTSLELASGGGELSALHLANMIKCEGGQVLPFPSRTRTTHYIVDHLSYTKARSEFAAMFVKSIRGAAPKPIHFVKPAWIRACMQAGCRVKESNFAVMQDESVKSLKEVFRTVQTLPDASSIHVKRELM